ncbi:hypothetical protein M1116_01640, partial [Patescibacteria group bacterium]|nr:hypothetical protein [Patescibacteria group bacterium]
MPAETVSKGPEVQSQPRGFESLYELAVDNKLTINSNPEVKGFGYEASEEWPVKMGGNLSIHPEAGGRTKRIIISGINPERDDKDYPLGGQTFWAKTLAGSILTSEDTGRVNSKGEKVVSISYPVSGLGGDELSHVIGMELPVSTATEILVECGQVLGITDSEAIRGTMQPLGAVLKENGVCQRPGVDAILEGMEIYQWHTKDEPKAAEPPKAEPKAGPEPQAQPQPQHEKATAEAESSEEEMGNNLFASLLAENKRLKEQLDEARRKGSKAPKESAEKANTEELAKAQKANEDLRSQNGQLKTERDKTQTALAEMQRQMAEMQNRLRATEQQRDQAQKAMAEQTSALGNYAHENGVLKDSLQQRENYIAEMVKRAKEGNNPELQKELKAVKEALGEANRAGAKREEALQAAQKREEAERNKANQLQIERDRLASENNNQKLELETLRKSKGKDPVTEAKLKELEFQAQANKTEAERARVLARNEITRANNAEARERAALLQVETLKRQKGDPADKIKAEAAERSLKQVQEVNAEQTRTIKELQKKLEEAERQKANPTEIRRLREEVQRWRDQLTESQSREQQLAAQVQGLQADKIDLQRQLRQEQTNRGFRAGASAGATSEEARLAAGVGLDYFASLP